MQLSVCVLGHGAVEVSRIRIMPKQLGFAYSPFPLLQLWHATAAVDSICLGDVGFDVRRAHKHGMNQALKDVLHVGGHVYGHGLYFAEFANYSHWWFARHTPGVDDEGAEYVTQLLAQVFTGRSKDYGSAWAPDLFLEPPGYHSVCGTESDQKVLPVVRLKC